MAGGLFTEHVFNTMKERDILRFEGPHGSFFLREESDKPIVLLASGTGFAPVKALVEHLLHLKSTRPVTLYWGGRRPHDLYMNELCEQWAAILPNFRYVPVVSRRAAGRPLERAHRLRPRRRDGRTCPTCPATRCMPAARRSWSTRRGAISSRSAGCRPTSSSPIRSPREADLAQP